jgi:hypothetical protein
LCWCFFHDGLIIEEPVLKSQDAIMIVENLSTNRRFVCQPNDL